MDAELKNKWIEALRSGDYEQGVGQLVAAGSPEWGEPDRFCCLGVLSDIMGDVDRSGDNFLFPLEGIDLNVLLWDDDRECLMETHEWSGENDESIQDGKIVAETMIPGPIAQELGLRVLVDGEDGSSATGQKELRNHLAWLNDQQCATFPEIADYLESIDF